MTHELPEFKEHYQEGRSTPIPYESILKHAGRFYKGRPVLTTAMTAHIDCPYPDSDADL